MRGTSPPSAPTSALGDFFGDFRPDADASEWGFFFEDDVIVSPDYFRWATSFVDRVAGTYWYMSSMNRGLKRAWAQVGQGQLDLAVGSAFRC